MIGQTISHYLILDKIGQGGMGEIYLAEDLKLHRQVALKFLPRQMTADTEARERFEREAQAAAALNHPNIVTVYEIGEHEGQVFIAMEYVEGQTLKELISSDRQPSTVNRLPIPEVLNIASQIASGLAVAHAKGIVHRDVKPQNILVDKDGRVKILDFGLAKLKGVSSLTKESSTLGTIHYMSPEQTMGKDVDHRTDIWSLGVVIYEMLTGKVPFKGDYEQAVIYAILNEEPGKATGMRNNIPAESDFILEKALAKDPVDRYQHADDLLVDLKHLKGDSWPDRQPSQMARQRKNGSWLKWAIPAVAVPLVMVAAILLINTKEKPKSAPPNRTAIALPAQTAWAHSIAVLPFKNLSDSKEDEYFSDGITEDILTQLAKISQLNVTSRTTIMRYKNTAKSLREIGRELNVGVVLEGSVRRSEGRIRISSQLIDATADRHLWAETYDRELQDVFAIQSDVAQKIAVALKAKLAPGEKERIERKQTENPEAYQLYLKGRFHWNKRKLEDIKAAIGYFQQAIAKDPDYAQAYSGLAMAYVLIPQYGMPAEEWYAKAKEAAAKTLHIDAALADAHMALGEIALEHHFDWAGAEKHFLRALELDPSNPTAHQWYSGALLYLGRFDEALAEAKKALELDPLSLVINMNLGDVLYTMRRFDRAIEQYQNTLALDPTFAWAHWGLACIHEKHGKLPEAIAEYETTNRLAGSIPYSRVYLGRIYAKAGRRNDARAVLVELLRSAQEGYSVSFGIALIYYELGEKDKAFSWLDKAFQNRDVWLIGLGTDPLFDDLRTDPRCSVLLKKIGLKK